MNIKNKAFTLAEVLITLGIIGVVAAITIPVVAAKVDHTQKISLLKKAHSAINQAVKLASDDYGDFESWDTSLSTMDYLSRYIAPYMKITLYCTTYKKCNYTSSTPWSRYNKANDYTGFNVFSRIPFFSVDGILYSISLSGGSTSADPNVQYDSNYIGKNSIFIDVNGSSPPNRFGNDVFLLVRNSDGSVMPLGYNFSDDVINKDCRKESKCLYCAEKLRRNGWKSTSDYPW